MLEKDESIDISMSSDVSQSLNLINLLSVKIPEVEEILTNSIKIIEEDQIKVNDEKYEGRLDLITAFNEILEIYELTKIVINSYGRKDKQLRNISEKLRECKYKYLDLQSNYHSIIEDSNSKEEQIKAFDEILRNIENENYELKIKIEDLNQIIKSQKHHPPFLTKNHLLKSSTLHDFKHHYSIIEFEEQIKSLLKENKELDSKTRNLLEIIKSKEDKIEELHKQNDVNVLKNKEIEDLLKKVKQDANNFKNEYINKRNSNVKVESVIQFNSNPLNHNDISKIEENIVLSEGCIQEKSFKPNNNNLCSSKNIQITDIYERKRSRLNVCLKENSKIDTPRREEFRIEEENESYSLDTSKKIVVVDQLNSSINLIGDKEDREQSIRKISFDFGKRLLRQNSSRVQNTLDVLLSAEREQSNHFLDNYIVNKAENILEVRNKREKKENQLIKPFSLSTDYSELFPKLLSKKKKKNQIEHNSKNDRKIKGRHRTRHLQLCFYRRKLKHLIKMSKMHNTVINTFKETLEKKEFFTPRILRYSDDIIGKSEWKDNLFYKTISNKKHNMDLNKSNINFDNISQNVIQKVHKIGFFLENLAVNNYFNAFQENKSFLENKINRKNQNLSKLYQFQQSLSRVILEESFTIRREKGKLLNLYISKPENICIRSVQYMKIGKGFFLEEELAYEIFNFSLEKTGPINKESSLNHKKINSVGQIKIGGKNIDFNINVSLEVKDKPTENSICIPFPSSTRTVETLVGSTKGNNNTYNNLDNQNNNITLPQSQLKECKDQLKDFYRKYLKYSDCFMMDSLSRMLPSGKGYKKKEKPRLWNDSYHERNMNHILFLRKNNMKLKKY